MNTDRAENSDCSRSVQSTNSSQEDLAWDNYSPPLHTCTDECSCTPSASQCTSCGRLASCQSCIGGPCSSLKSWPDSQVPSSRGRSRPSPFAWPSCRGGVRRDETDSRTTVDDLKSANTPSCSSRVSRIVSASQDGVLVSSVVLSGKPSSASIDFRGKCTAYWDGVRSLHSLASSTGCPTEATTAEDTCTSVYSLLSLPDSESSHQSTLRIFQSFRAPNGTVRLDRISVGRTLRPHSADDICRLRFASGQDKRSRDDDPTLGHGTKRICSAVQFSQVVTTHCYDNEHSYSAALPGRDCNAICHMDTEDQEKDKGHNDKINMEDDACDGHCKDLAVLGDKAESEHTGDSDYTNNGHHRRYHHSNHGHHSKRHRHHSQNTKHHKDVDHQPEDHEDHDTEERHRDRLSKEHDEDSLPCRDPIDCSLVCGDNSDQSHHCRDDDDTRRHTRSQGHHCHDSEHTDLCCDSEDQHLHHTKQYNDHCLDSSDHSDHGHHKRDHSEDHSRDHHDHGHHKVDHSEDHSKDHHDHGHRKVDHSEDHSKDHHDHGHHEVDHSEDHSKDHNDHGHHKRDHSEHHSKDHNEHGHHKRDHSEDRYDHSHHSRQHTDSKVQHVRHSKQQNNHHHDSKDHGEHGHHKRDHSEDHHDQRQHSREHTESHKSRGKRHPNKNNDSSRDISDLSDCGLYTKDDRACCRDANDQIDHGHRSREHHQRFHESRDHNDHHFRHRSDHRPCGCDSKDNTEHKHHRRDLENSSHDSTDQNVHTHRNRDNTDSHNNSRDNNKHENQRKCHTSNRPRLGNLDCDCAQNIDPDHRSSDQQSLDSPCGAQSCFKDCPGKENHKKRQGHKHHRKNSTDSEDAGSNQTDTDHGKHHMRRRKDNECGSFRLHNALPVQDCSSICHSDREDNERKDCIDKINVEDDICNRHSKDLAAVHGDDAEAEYTGDRDYTNDGHHHLHHRHHHLHHHSKHGSQSKPHRNRSPTKQKHRDSDQPAEEHDEGQGLRDQKHSEGGYKSYKENSADKIYKDPRFKHYKDLESYSFNSDSDSEFNDYIKELKRRQSKFLQNRRGYRDSMNNYYENEREAKDGQKKIKNKIGKNEEGEQKRKSKYEVDSECDFGDIANLRCDTSCDGTKPEFKAEEIQMDHDILFCENLEEIAPLEYLTGRATISFEGELDERPSTTSPFLYEPIPVPLRYSNPEPPKELLSIEQVTQAKSKQGFEPQLEFPRQSHRAPSRVSAQIAPSISIAPPYLSIPGRPSKTPVVAYESTVEGIRRPTSIRDKAENMPVVRRVTPLHMGDFRDIGQIESMSKKQSWGLKPELVSNELETVAYITQRSIVESERRMPNKTVGWVEQVAPIPSITVTPVKATASSVDADSRFVSTAASTSQDKQSSVAPRTTAQSMNSSVENRMSSQAPGSRIPSAPAKSTLRSILVGSRIPEESRLSSMPTGSRLSSMPTGSRLSSMPENSRVSSISRRSQISSVPEDSRVYSMPGGSRGVSSISEDSRVYSMPGGSRGVSSMTEDRMSSMPGGSRLSSMQDESRLSSMAEDSRMFSTFEESTGSMMPEDMPDRLSSMAGEGRLSSMPEDSIQLSIVEDMPDRLTSIPGGSRWSSSIPGGSRLSSIPNDGRLTSYDEANSYAYPDNSASSVGPEDARYSIIPDFESNRHSFGYSHRKNTLRLQRQSETNPYGLHITQFVGQSQVLVAPPQVAREDIFSLDVSATGVELIPAIQDLTVQIPSATQRQQSQHREQPQSQHREQPQSQHWEQPIPKQPSSEKPSAAAKSDDSDLTCLKELLAVPLSGVSGRQNNSESEISADSTAGQRLQDRSSDPCLDTLTSAIPFGQTQRSSKRPLLNAHPSENCLCTSVTQVVSRSMKHGINGESDPCATARDKRNPCYSSKWYRSLSSKTIHDTPSEGSIPDRNSFTSEMRPATCHSSRTSTWLDCYTLPGSDLRHSRGKCTDRLLDGEEYCEEMRDASSCTDSVTTIYTRLPTSSVRHRSLNGFTRATESCNETGFPSSTRCGEEFDQRQICRNCRQSSLAANVSCFCPPAGDKIVCSNVIASGRHVSQADSWNDGRISKEQTFERKYKALKRYCMETLGCVPSPSTSLNF